MNANDMMTEQRLEILEGKLADAKPAYRSFALVALAVATCMIGSTVLRATSADAQSPIFTELSANKFILVDATGKPRALLSALPDRDGAPILTLYDARGKPRAALGAFPEAGGTSVLSMYDAKGRTRAALGLSGQTGGIPTLSLYDGRGRTRATLAVLAESQGGPTLSLYDSTGMISWCTP